MSDNVTVTNPLPNSDYIVRATDVTSGQIQHVRIDFGASTAEETVTDSNPLPTQISDGTYSADVVHTSNGDFLGAIIKTSGGVTVDNFGASRTALTVTSNNLTPITTATSTSIVTCPALKSLRIHTIHATNTSSTAVLIGFKDGSGGSVRWHMYLNQFDTKTVSLAPNIWTLTGQTNLYLYTSAAGSIYWTVAYDTEDYVSGGGD